MDLALNNLQWLIRHKTKPNKNLVGLCNAGSHIFQTIKQWSNFYLIMETIIYKQLLLQAIIIAIFFTFILAIISLPPSLSYCLLLSWYQVRFFNFSLSLYPSLSLSPPEPVNLFFSLSLFLSLSLSRATEFGYLRIISFSFSLSPLFNKVFFLSFSLALSLACH